MSRPTMAASMIVRDEESVMGRCLDSIAPLVDQAVVVDTGSTDATAAIARAKGATVVEFPWCDDFSAARNVGLDAVECDFVLYIDADERVSDPGNLSLDPAHAGYRVLLQARPGHSPYREHRIFRADPSIRFHGVIHESIIEPLYAYAERTGRPIVETTMRMVHDGYEGTGERKAHRNIPLLRRQIENQPWRGFLRHDLGVSLYALGRHDEARAAFQEGVDLVRSRGWAEPVDVVNFVHLAWMLGDDGIEILGEAEQRFPDNPHVAWAIAGRAMASGEPDVVISRLEPLTTWTEADMIATDLAYDQTMFGPELYRALADAAIAAGEWERARAWLEQLADLEPDDPSTSVKLQLARARG